MSSPHQETPAYRLSDRMVSDARVTPTLTTCLHCGAKLPEKQTAGSGSEMLLFVQCVTDGCKRVYMLDYASFR